MLEFHIPEDLLDETKVDGKRVNHEWRRWDGSIEQGNEIAERQTLRLQAARVALGYTPSGDFTRSDRKASPLIRCELFVGPM